MNENIKKFGVGFFNEQEKMFVKEKNLLLKILVEKLTDEQIINECDKISSTGRTPLNKKSMDFLYGIEDSYYLSNPHRISYQQRFFTCKTILDTFFDIKYIFLADYISYNVKEEKVTIYYKNQFCELSLLSEVFKENLAFYTGIKINYHEEINEYYYPLDKYNEDEILNKKG